MAMASNAPPFLSNAHDEDDDDVESPARGTGDGTMLRRPGPASRPSPAGGVDRIGNRRSFTIDDADDDGDDDEDAHHAVRGAEGGASGLTERTSRILGEFREYVGAASGSLGREEEAVTFEGGGEEVHSSLAGAVRSDGKMRLLENDGTGGGGANGFRRKGSAYSAGSAGGHNHNDSGTFGDDYSNGGGTVGGLDCVDWEDDPEAAGMVRRGKKYTHPLVHSRRVKFGLINSALVAAVVLAAILGVTNRSERAGKALQSQIGELEEELAKDKELEEELQGGEGGDNDWWAQDEEDQSRDWLETQNQLPHVTIGLPTGSQGESDAEKMVELVTEHGGNGNGNQYSNIPPHKITPEEFEIHSSAVERYQPQEYGRQDGWVGRTYPNALQFCGERDSDLCPYDAICPLGPDNQPLGGYKERLKGSWVPIADRDNDWVQLSHENACVRYSNEHADPPDWGLVGDEDADVVAHVMCCARPHDDAGGDKTGPALAAHGAGLGVAAYKSAAEKYQPREFDRGRGWHGKTYAQARDFCAGAAGRGVCPYDAVCPLGTGHEPLGGYYKAGPAGEVWLPVSDRENDWVNVAESDPCIRYSGKNVDPPQWGETGNGSEEITGYVTCCLLQDEDVEVGEDNAGGQNEEEEDPGDFEIYNAAVTRYQPQWFSRGEGWSGRTYDEAFQFCRRNDGRVVCPYDAVCPLGPDTQPLGGYHKRPGGSWIPISDSENDWVQLSQEDACVRWLYEHADPPVWEVKGDEDADQVAHVLCCVEALTDFVADEPPAAEKVAENGKDGNSEGDQTAPPPKLTQKEVEAYQAAVKKYQPKAFDRKKGWEGKSYLDAYEFCTSKANYGLCPYDAVCPLGPDTQPLGGYREIDVKRASWTPISDSDNDWIQLKHENSCIRYSNEHASPPEWGIAGHEDEDIVSNILCCVSSWKEALDEVSSVADEGASSPPVLAANAADQDDEMAAYEAAYDEFEPIKFGREDSWKGRTYLEAVQFCARLEGYYICPYEALCPLGPDREPLAGYSETDGSPSWVPTSDSPNKWVSLAPDDSCRHYKTKFSEEPMWGLTREDNEDITRNIVCCKGSIMGTGEEGFLYEIMAKKHRPTWYGRDDGWAGRTYDEAWEFCRSRPWNKARGLCPYEAYCPMADLDVPLGGLVVDEPGGSWVPIADSHNAWISVGPENTCKNFDAANGKPPEWGNTGVGNEEITRHILCCDIVVDEGVDSREQHVTEVTSKTTKDPTHYPSPAPTTPAPTPLPLSKPTPPPTPLPSSKPTSPPTPLPSNQPTPSPVKTAITPSAETATTTEAYNSGLNSNPVWYDRSSGWTGQTYDEAFTFCSKQGPEYDVCPYAAICPGGPMKPPYGGSKDEANEAWSPVNDAFNEWVQVSDPKVCVRYRDVNPASRPAWGMTGEGNEEITRHIACCNTDNLTGDTSVVAQGITSNHQDVSDMYAPAWYTRDDSWVGKTYAESIVFCAKQDSAIPCPYEAYCPDGPGSQPVGGSRQGQALWAPIMDIPNGWVNVGSSPDSCKLYNSLQPTPPLWGLSGHEMAKGESGGDTKDRTAHIMCCREPPAGDTISALQSTASSPVPIANTMHEQDILDKMHPIWFGRKHGYNGNTHQEAADFCKSISDMVLCPAETYCPEDSSDTEKPLFLQKSAFEGEQWAPVATVDTNAQDHWILIGTLNGVSQSTCSTFNDVKGMKPKGWNVDDGKPELKENVLCCLNPNHLLKEISFAKDLDRVWLGDSLGWKGGSHDDAIEFCQKLGNKKLCPYTAYCPHGAGQPAIGGHVEDFNLVGEQWAPVLHDSPVHHETNYWVMIGQKYQNSATTCMDNWDLEGHEPEWGMSNENADMKRHIMCCNI